MLFAFDGGAGPLGAVGIASRTVREEGLALLVPGYTPDHPHPNIAVED